MLGGGWKVLLYELDKRGVYKWQRESFLGLWLVFGFHSAYHRQLLFVADLYWIGPVPTQIQPLVWRVGPNFILVAFNVLLLS